METRQNFSKMISSTLYAERHLAEIYYIFLRFFYDEQDRTALLYRMFSHLSNEIVL